MSYYPVFLDLKDKPVLIVGAGRVALRKAKGLLEAGARVTVVAPRANPGFDELGALVVRREFRPEDLDGVVLAFAATDDREVNHGVGAEAKRRGIPVNVADQRSECDFIVPARIRSGDLEIAVSTSGRSPRLAVELRRKLEAVLRDAGEV